MIECVFTLDYEIYGNGTGSLRELIYEPGDRLREIFHRRNVRFVNFVEVAELEKIEQRGTDPAIELVKKQVRAFYREGFEIALHLHPQWCNAHYDGRHWILDPREYNLCSLPSARIAEIVSRSLDYLRFLVGESSFTPLSFRAGNWLFQPTRDAARILAKHGLRLDSSVFKGGLQHNHHLDYRRLERNGSYWRFDSDVTEPDALGRWIEVPIHTEMVPIWRLWTSKRMGCGNTFGMSQQSGQQKLNRILDFLRFRYPLKLDFCRMTLREWTAMIHNLIVQDRGNPSVCRPVVAIGHTKDLTDPQAVDDFLRFLESEGIGVATFEAIYPKLFERHGQKFAA